MEILNFPILFLILKLFFSQLIFLIIFLKKLISLKKSNFQFFLINIIEFPL